MIIIKRYKDIEYINEEFLGKVVNFFKNMWNKTIEELERIGNDPNSVKDYVIKNTFNLKDDTNVFSELIKNFNKQLTTNDQSCMELISSMLDKEKGSLGKEGIGVMFSDKRLQGDNMKARRRMMEYIISNVRTSMSKDIGFDEDPKNRNINLEDSKYLPDLKKILKISTEEDKKKEATINYINTSLVPKLINLVKSLREEDIRAVLEKEGIELAPDFKLKDIVLYKREKYNDKKDKDEQDEDAIAKGEVRKIEGDNITIFNSNLNAEIKKSKSDIIGKFDSKKDINILDSIKDDKDKMSKVTKFAEFIKDDKNKDKITQIENILSGNK